MIESAEEFVRLRDSTIQEEYHLFQRLAEDEDEGVRKAIAINKKVPLDILEQLTHDKSAWVAEEALYRLAERQASTQKKIANDAAGG